MQRQRGELVPVGEVIGGLGGPVKLIRDATPQAGIVTLIVLGRKGPHGFPFRRPHSQFPIH